MIHQMENFDLFIKWLYWFDKFWLFLPNIKFESAWVLVLLDKFDSLFRSFIYHYWLLSLISRETQILRPPIFEPNDLFPNMIIGYAFHFEQEFAIDSSIVIMLVADHLVTTSLTQWRMILQFQVARILTVRFIMQKIKRIIFSLIIEIIVDI